MKLLDTTGTPIEELQYASESISSFASDALGTVSKMASRLRDLLPGIAQNFADSKTVGALLDLKNLSKEQQQFIKLLDSASFAEIRQLRADTPEGFVGDFLSYATVLHGVADNLTNLASGVLNPYTVFLAQLISSRNAGMANDDKRSLYLKMKKEREAGYSAIGAFFPAKNKEGNQRIGEIIQRNNDWPGVFKMLTDTVNKINAVDRNQLTQLISQAEDYLNIVHDMLVEGKLSDVTPATSRALADGAFEVASHVEYYSVVHFKTLAFSNAVKGTVERVNGILG